MHASLRDCQMAKLNLVTVCFLNRFYIVAFLGRYSCVSSFFKEKVNICFWLCTLVLLNELFVAGFLSLSSVTILNRGQAAYF